MILCTAVCTHGSVAVSFPIRSVRHKFYYGTAIVAVYLYSSSSICGTRYCCTYIYIHTQVYTAVSQEARW